MPLRPGYEGASKRKGNFTPESAGAAKRLKARRDARDIITQPANAALKDGALNLGAFLEARQFEISALEESMRLSKASRSQRAFQRVPRDMRRRTASHNPKRVPKRLRMRALREMAEDNTPTVTSRRRKPRTTRARIRAETAKRLGLLTQKRRQRKARAEKERSKSSKSGEDDTTMADRVDGQTVKSTCSATHVRVLRPKIRRNALNEPPATRSKFRKRQINKTWLPTHVWHAKRAHMTDPKTPLWRFAIPLRPNEKMFRVTHRTLSDRGALAWDMSYISTIGLYGRFAGVERVLKKLGLCTQGLWGDKGRRWRAGVRSWSGMLSKEESDHGSRAEICPGIVIWNPVATSDSQANQQDAQVFIRVHPAAFFEVFETLLTYTKMETPKVYIEDLRFEIGSIDITGPSSIEALLSVIKPYHTEDTTTKHASTFMNLCGLTNPSTLPTGAILGFDMVDPRLHYPPKTVQFTAKSTSTLMDTLETWNASVEDDLRPYSIWNRAARHSASQLPTKKALDRRKTHNPPGKPLPVGPNDPPIPVLLLATRSQPGTRALGTLSVLLPWKCVQPLWHSLMHVPLASGGNPRFGGLREIAQAHDERNMPLFPRDFPTTRAGAEYELQKRQEREKEWTKRPKCKRTSWAAVNLGAGRKGELGNPYASDYGLIFSGTTGDAFNPNKMRQVCATDAKGLTLPLSLPEFSVIRVKITFFSQGIATPAARVYRLPSLTSQPPTATTASESVEVPATQPHLYSSNTGLPPDLRQQWLALTSPAAKPSSNGGRRTFRLPTNTSPDSKKEALAAHLTTGQIRPFPPVPNYQEDIQGHPMCPGADRLVGFVTSGGYSLNCGKSTAIATLRADSALEDALAARKNKNKQQEKEAFLCVVRNPGREIAWIARWEII
ncbi:Ribonucleases P/MRP protein subunit pop1 [Ceratocystis lukuohia]|uniref:Ribonucleases P/MRP protein subunit pop1 n=1 Tax=Ceratocystis lukuohia TaxID=2019550 RepID=A0ABR4MRT9_9PEZI